MSIPRWRLAFTLSAAAVLAMVGVGWVLAGTQAAATVVEPIVIDTGQLESTEGAGGTVARDPAHGRPGVLRRLARARHLVHAEVTYLDREGQLVARQFDHGTIESIGYGSLTIREADGRTVTVTTDEETVVRLGRERGDLGDLAIGDDVVIHSRVEGDSPVARHVLRLPPVEGG
ncbi:MAG TPA: hypothetical protein VK831_07185 [Candidatus Deferrimicrobiaceae bacterium]|nr:hypothetical protein [Candidatus Deferrimicrobiaceae bacterium]